MTVFSDKAFLALCSVIIRCCLVNSWCCVPCVELTRRGESLGSGSAKSLSFFFRFWCSARFSAVHEFRIFKHFFDSGAVLTSLLFTSFESFALCDKAIVALCSI